MDLVEVVLTLMVKLGVMNVGPTFRKYVSLLSHLSK